MPLKFAFMSDLMHPVLAYIGRPVFESDVFSLDLLKSTHRIASACTAMFMNGISRL